MKITNINLTEKEGDLAIVYNGQMVNFTVISHFLTFEMDFVHAGNHECYYPEYYNDIVDVYDKVPEPVLVAIDYLLENGMPSFEDCKDYTNHEEFIINGYKNNNRTDIKSLTKDYISIDFLRYDKYTQINEDKKKKNLLFNIGEYLNIRNCKIFEKEFNSGNLLGIGPIKVIKQL